MDKLFPALCLAWFASESWVFWRRRSGDRLRSRDAGTLPLLATCIGTALALAIWFDALDALRFAAALQGPLWWGGIALMAFGMPLRWWAVRVLADRFTVDVAIRPGHALVRAGPYCWLRHPSYTGLLLTFAGFGLALGNWGSLLAATVPVVLALLWRIQVEEAVLREAFPTQYPAYARATWRLLPFVW